MSEPMYRCGGCGEWVRSYSGSDCVCTPKRTYEAPPVEIIGGWTPADYARKAAAMEEAMDRKRLTHSASLVAAFGAFMPAMPHVRTGPPPRTDEDIAERRAKHAAKLARRAKRAGVQP